MFKAFELFSLLLLGCIVLIDRHTVQIALHIVIQEHLSMLVAYQVREILLHHLGHCLECLILNEILNELDNFRPHLGL